jgi:hypothetical protein
MTYYELLIVYNSLPDDDWTTQSKHAGSYANEMQLLVKNKKI